jgi:hypothetical protein
LHHYLLPHFHLQMSTLSALYTEERANHSAVMHHHQNLQRGGFAAYPPYPSSTDSDSMDSVPGAASAPNGFADQNQNQNQNQTTAADVDTHEFFVVGDLDLEQQLDPWRRNVPSPMPRITDAITQGTFFPALQLFSYCSDQLPLLPVCPNGHGLPRLACSAVQCQSVAETQWSVVSGQWSVVSGRQWSVGAWSLAAASSPRLGDQNHQIQHLQLDG